MEFIDIAVEQTTVATDAVLAFIAAVCAVYLYKIREKEKGKAKIWIWFCIFMAAAALLGAAAHGLKISETLKTVLWQPLYLSLGLVTAFFASAAVYDIWGQTAAQKILRIMIILGILFFAGTLIYNIFLLFIIYELAAVLFALAGYTRLGLKHSLTGAWFMAAGVFVSMAAAVIQASGCAAFTFIWEFDHNGIYHLIQTAGILLLTAGVRKDLLSR